VISIEKPWSVNLVVCGMGSKIQRRIRNEFLVVDVIVNCLWVGY